MQIRSYFLIIAIAFKTQAKLNQIALFYFVSVVIFSYKKEKLNTFLVITIYIILQPLITLYTKDI